MNFHDIFCPHPSYVYFRCTKNFMKKLNMFIIENKDTIDVQCNSKNEDIFLSHKKLETGVLIETKMLILWNDKILKTERKRIYIDSRYIDISSEIRCLKQLDIFTVICDTEEKLIKIDLLQFYKPYNIRRVIDLYFNFV